MNVDKYNFDEKVKNRIDTIPGHYKAAFFILLFVSLLFYATYLFLSAFSTMPESGVDIVALRETIFNN